MEHFSIAIDGPAGAGKSTVAKLVASKLKIDYIDTGAMYRAFTLKLINNNINFENLESVVEILKATSIDFKDNHIYLDNVIVDEEIRDNEISNNVSQVAKIKEVRERLVELQREIAKNKSTVMDGRDIGSTVIKDAKENLRIVTAAMAAAPPQALAGLSRRRQELVAFIIEHETGPEEEGNLSDELAKARSRRAEAQSGGGSSLP